MEIKTELYDSAYSKMQRLYESIFDDKGNLKPQFNLTDGEVEAFRNNSNNMENSNHLRLQSLFDFIIYNRCNIILKEIKEIAIQIERMHYYRFYYKGENMPVFYNGYVTNFNKGENIYYEIYTGGQSITLNLFNLDGGIDVFNIAFETRNNKIPQMQGNITILKEKRIVGSGKLQTTQYGSRTSYDINQIYSQEIINILLTAKEKLSRVLNNLINEYGPEVEKLAINKKR